MSGEDFDWSYFKPEATDDESDDTALTSGDRYPAKDDSVVYPTGDGSASVATSAGNSSTSRVIFSSDDQNDRGDGGSWQAPMQPIDRSDGTNSDGRVAPNVQQRLGRFLDQTTALRRPWHGRRWRRQIVCPGSDPLTLRRIVGRTRGRTSCLGLANHRWPIPRRLRSPRRGLPWRRQIGWMACERSRRLHL
jgi:hypothetical protein